MLIRIKPRHVQRIALFAAFALVLLGARLGVAVRDPVATAKISPLVRVTTQEPQAGVIVELFQAEPEAVEQLLAVLVENGWGATWFCSATFAESQAQLLSRLVEAGSRAGAVRHRRQAHGPVKLRRSRGKPEPCQRSTDENIRAYALFLSPVRPVQH